jgi:hypothetical protein
MEQEARDILAENMIVYFGIKNLTIMLFTRKMFSFPMKAK